MKKLIFLSVVAALISFSISNAQDDLSLSIQVAPPELPVYSQPPCPYDGYMWTPGYWAYNTGGYYWVPGVWVYPPTPGFLWTPSYWAFSGGYYGWHSGYWGEHVGFYGGVNYGYGYGGVGFGGGRWEGRSFHYNTAVMNVNTTVIHNTYQDRAVINTANNRTSFNGAGGISSRPTNEEQTAMHERHENPTAEQTSHHLNAGKDNNQLATVNHGHPSTMAVKSVKDVRINQEGPVSKPMPSNNPEPGRTREHEEHTAKPNSTSTMPAIRPLEHPRVNPSEQHVNPKRQSASPSTPHVNPRQSQPKSGKRN